MHKLSRIASHSIRSSFAAATCLLAIGLANAQDYPAKPIRIIVPVAPGSTADIVARIMAPGMSRTLEQSTVVENKPGADQLLAYEYVAKQAPADGYTIATVQAASLAVLPATTKDLRFDPLKDLPPFIGLVETVTYFGSSAKVPWKNFQEMVAYGKANQGKLNYAYPSAITRFKMEMLFQGLGLNVTPIAYKGGGILHQAILNAEVHFGIVSRANVDAAGDRFRVLAVSGKARQAALPNVPTFAELGFPQILGGGFSFNLRSGVPQPVIAKLYNTAAKVLQQPDTRDKFDKIAVEIISEPPEVATKSLIDDAKMYSDVVRKIGL